MADALIIKVRRRVDDAGVTPIYADVYYSDALEAALGRLNIDIHTDYTRSNLPAKYLYPLELLATIDMCYVRGTEGADATPAVGAVQTVTVPNLSVTKSTGGEPAGPDYWLELAERLSDDYAAAVAAITDIRESADTGIQVGTIFRTSLRTGRRTPYVMDTALTATTLAAEVDGTSVALTWTAVYEHHFSRYLIKRAPTDAFVEADTVEVVSEYDNHTVTYTDTPGVGTWYYKIVVINDNALEAESAAVEAEVV